MAQTTKEEFLMRVIFVFAVTFMMSSIVYGSVQDGTVTRVSVRNNGVHWFYVTGNRTARPDCATFTYWFIQDENSVSGKSQFSMLLSAYLSGKTVTIEGTGSCSRHHDGEDIKDVVLR